MLGRQFYGALGMGLVLSLLGMGLLGMGAASAVTLPGTETNHALGSFASQSSTAVDGDAFRAVDGNFIANAADLSVAATTNANPGAEWWQTDLNGNRTIDKIRLHNRTSGDSSLLSDLTVSIYDVADTGLTNPLLVSPLLNPNNELSGAPLAPAGLTTLTWDVSMANGGTPINGGIVRVHSADNAVVLSEVEILGNDGIEVRPNVAVGKTATASSSAFGGIPSYVVDGNVDGRYGNNSVWHSSIATGRQEYWQVDLGAQYDLDGFALWSRVDNVNEFGGILHSIVVDVFAPDGETVVYSSGTLNPNGWINGDKPLVISESLLGQGVAGRYVRVTNVVPAGPGVNAYLAIAEVEVFGALSENVTKLTIDRNTGAMTLQNNTGSDLRIVGYSITSASGALDQEEWISIAGNYDAGSGGSTLIDVDDNWTILTAAGSTGDLSEAQFGGSPSDGGVLVNGTLYNLGTAWIQNRTEDVALQLLLETGEKISATVTFQGNGGEALALGDLDFSGSSILTQADWTAFKAGAFSDLSLLSPAQAYQRGDLNGDGRNDFTDFQMFVDLYEAGNGAGSFAAMLQNAPVPEPASMVLVLAGVALFAGRRLGRRVRPMATALLAAGLLVAGMNSASAVVLPGSQTNHALGSTATQSSTNAAATADKAVDGTYHGDYFYAGVGVPATTHTNADVNPWWQTVLPGNRPIDEINVYNRIDGTVVDHRLQNLRITIYDVADVGLTNPLATSPLFNPNNVLNGPSTILWDVAAQTGGTVNGGIVRLQLETGAGTQFLHVGEVEILERDGIAVRPNFAVGKRSYQSTNFSPVDGLAGNANDGNRDGDWAKGSVTHTQQAVGRTEYWEVDFGVTSEIDAVSLWSRLDNGNISGGAVSDVRIEVYDANRNPVYSSATLNPGDILKAPNVITENLLGQGIQGQFVRVANVRDAFFLSLAEVEVFGKTPDLLKLQVNATTGEVTIVNPDAGDFRLKSYVVESAAGALDESGWDSIELNGQSGLPQGNGSGNGWERAAGTPGKAVGELYLLGSSDFSSVSSLSLGELFDTSVFGVRKAGDLVFKFLTESGYEFEVDVVYTNVDLQGDFNGDGTVDAADYVVWRNNLNGNESALNGNGNGDSVVDIADYNLWKNNFGNTASGGALLLTHQPVPEPATVGLLLVAAAGLAIPTLRRRSLPMNRLPLAALLVAALAFASTAQGVVIDSRYYSMGDFSDGSGFEGTTAANGPDGAPVGSSFGGTSDVLDTINPFIDLDAVGNPVYASLSSGPYLRTNRGAGNNYGILFDGDGDYASNSTVLNNVGSGGSQGMQLWAFPTATNLGVTAQVLAFDTVNGGGPGITANGFWSQINSGHSDLGGTVAVVPNQWVHVAQHIFLDTDANSPDVVPGTGAARAFTSVIYVNGVAVSANNDIDLGPTQTSGAFVVGAADQAPPASAIIPTAFFSGVIDELKVYRSDANAFDLMTDNDWIAAALPVNYKQGDLNFDGNVDDGDVTLFVGGWLKEKRFDGAHNDVWVGDYETLGWGDIDLNGRVDLDDAFLLHVALKAGGGAGLDFSLLGGGVSVPEPATVGLGALLVGIGVGYRRWMAKCNLKVSESHTALAAHTPLQGGRAAFKLFGWLGLRRC